MNDGYRPINFPFEDRPAPGFRVTADWDLAACLGYLSSWSAVQRYRARHAHHPVAPIRPELTRAWRGERRTRTVWWPLHLRIGVMPSTGDGVGSIAGTPNERTWVRRFV